jgi:hypothetical protein
MHTDRQTLDKLDKLLHTQTEKVLVSCKYSLVTKM